MLLDYVEKLINGCFATIPRSKPTAQQAQKTRLIAHRGAHDNSQTRFENTMAAFQLAKDVGCWGIELDVHATKDGVIVVNHDPSLQRLWNQPIYIADLNFSELRSLVPGVPSLEEVVQTFGSSMHLFVELKAPFNHEDALLESLKSLTPVNEFHLLALSPDIFSSLQHFPKGSLLLVSGHDNNRRYCEKSLSEQWGGVLGSYLLMTAGQINELKSAQQVYGVGFVDSKYSLYREMNRGIEWIFTNQAVRVSQYLKTLS